MTKPCESWCSSFDECRTACWWLMCSLVSVGCSPVTCELVRWWQWCTLHGGVYVGCSVSTTFKIMGPPKTMMKKKVKRWSCVYTDNSVCVRLWSRVYTDNSVCAVMKPCLHWQQCVCGYEAVSTLTTVCVRLWSRVYTDNSVCAIMKLCLHGQQCVCGYEAVSTRTTVCVPRCRFVCYNSCMELWLTLFIWYQMNNVQHRKVILSQACYDLGNTTFQLLSHSQFVWTTLTSVCITFLQISITVGDFSNDRQFLAETLDLLLISKFSFCCLVGLVRICLQLEIRPKIWFNPSLKYSIWYWNVILQAFFLISRRPDLLLIENHLIFVHLFRFYDGPSS